METVNLTAEEDARVEAAWRHYLAETRAVEERAASGEKLLHADWVAPWRAYQAALKGMGVVPTPLGYRRMKR